jgi:hypothetical protein
LKEGSGGSCAQGFLAFPLCVPGTKVWKGKQGRLFILGVLKKAAARSKAAMQVSVEIAGLSFLGLP